MWQRSQRHINLLELETVQLVLTHFAPRLRDRDAQDGPPLGTDLFAHHNWPKGLLYAFPPLSCVARLLARIKADHLTVIVVAPDLPGAMVSGNDSIVGCGAVATSPSRGHSPRLEHGSVISGPLKVWLLRGTD
ncbi:hypothetical protein DPEC_G00219230 [Dallia pectoralis]|uniref:Uncharacterized protein n=1 Tax=Dallia pectoralis TaxID=75939 RepID=A0ACC2G3K6_DALPE|nr:hypothetical protein DPEC_G00219230 [Dallia pectoralis]